MPQIKVTLNIGIANAEQEDTIHIDQCDWDSCETETDRNDMMNEYWVDWSNNYIDGSFEIIE